MCRSVYRRPNRAQSQGGVLGLADSCFAEARSRQARRFRLHRGSSHPQLAICDSGAIILIAGGGNKHNLPRPCAPSGCKASPGAASSWRVVLPGITTRSAMRHQADTVHLRGTKVLVAARGAGARPLLEVDAAPHGIQAHPERVHRPRGHPASGHGPDRSLDHPTRPAGSRRMAADTDDPLWTVLFGGPSDRRGIRREAPASSRGDRQGARCPSGFNG